MHGQTISGLTLQTTVANHVANFAFDSEVVNTSARGRGTVQLVGDYYANATIDTQAIPLAPLVTVLYIAYLGAGALAETRRIAGDTVPLPNPSSVRAATNCHSSLAPALTTMPSAARP